MNCAILGWGYWGKIIEKYIKESDYFTIKNIYDPVLSKEISLDDIFNDKEIECVFICTPINTHYDLAMRALSNGKHVFCEKPLCKQYERIIQLSEVSLKKNVCLYTDFIYTNSKSIQYMKNHIMDIGKILYIKSSIKQFGNFYKNDDTYEVIGVHIMSAILFILSDFEDVKFEIVKNHIIRKDNNNKVMDGILNFILNKQISGSIECSLVSNNKSRVIEIIAEKGTLRFDMLGNNTVEKIMLKEEDGEYNITDEEKLYFPENNNLSFVISDFYKTMTEKKGNGNLKLSMEVTKILEDIKACSSEN